MALRTRTLRGTAMVYPTLIAAVSDAVEPRDRAVAIGIYRFWRDAGFVVGGLFVGVIADLVSNGGAIATVAAVTALSGVVVATTTWGGAARPGAGRGPGSVPGRLLPALEDGRLPVGADRP